MHPKQGISVDQALWAGRPRLAGGSPRGGTTVWWCWGVGLKLKVGGR
jgi:hypothetical protein